VKALRSTDASNFTRKSQKKIGGADVGEATSSAYLDGVVKSCLDTKATTIANAARRGHGAYLAASRVGEAEQLLFKGGIQPCEPRIRCSVVLKALYKEWS
jgi:ABC-type sugar transport system substrate-binding protein